MHHIEEYHEGYACRQRLLLDRQRCTASLRLIVQAGIHDVFVEKLTAAMQRSAIGNALDPATKVCPVASEAQLQSNLRYVDVARDDGAEVFGGERLERGTAGF